MSRPDSLLAGSDWHVPPSQVPLMLAAGYVRPLPDGTYEMTEAGAAHVIDFCKRQEEAHRG